MEKIYYDIAMVVIWALFLGFMIYCYRTTSKMLKDQKDEGE